LGGSDGGRKSEPAHSEMEKRVRIKSRVRAVDASA